MGPLRVHPANPRYFADETGRPVLLAGSHHWDNLVDNGERPGGLDFPAHLDRLASWGHNFIRLWAIEGWLHPVRPMPWPRTGPGTALDGGPRWDLSRFDPEYVERLRRRVALAGERGFWVSVMLFNGWSLRDNGAGNPWFAHPFNRENNVNGIDGDPDARGEGTDVHTLRVPAITRLQEAYAGKVVETVGSFGHVLWEISNESPGESRDWQYHLIRHVKDLASHPVGMTSCFPRGRNSDLFDSPADWISPNRHGGYMTSPPPGDGRKVVVVDTDHLWGIGGGRDWVWKTFTRGLHPIYMDPLDDSPLHQGARQAMGDVLRFAKRIDLAAALPETEYCLANRTPGAEQFLAYLPGRRAKVNLSGIRGELAVEWFDPATGTTVDGGRVEGGGKRRFAPPFRGEGVVVLSCLSPLSSQERGRG
jgi:hypothetical protein